ncbi:hypothetical protein Tco_1284563 [Tanacetum coccineum]
MASLDYRLNPLFTFRECSSYVSLYNKECCCSNISSIGKFVHDSNKAPDLPPHPHTFLSNQRHCFHCKDVLGDGEFCQRCTCMRCGSGLSKGLCLICASRYGNKPNLNSLNDSPNIPKNVSQSPPLIDYHCCYECGDSLDDIFCQRCTCKSCGNGAHYGYNCPPKVPTISNPEPCNNQTIDELPQTLPSFDPTCYSGDGNSFTYDSTPNFVNDSPNVFNPPPQHQYVPYSCELCGNDTHHGYDCPPQIRSFSSAHENSLKMILLRHRFHNTDYSSVVMGDDDYEDIDFVDAFTSMINELVSLECGGDCYPDSGGFDTDILLHISRRYY